MLDLTSERSLVAKSRRRLRSMVLATAGHVSRRTVSMPLASNPGVTCMPNVCMSVLHYKLKFAMFDRNPKLQPALSTAIPFACTKNAISCS